MATEESNTRVQEENVDRKEDPPNYQFLSLAQINSLLEDDVDGVQRQIEEFLEFKEYQTNLKEAILVDYYVSGFWWGKEMKFTSQQLVGFMALLHDLLENVGTKHMTLEENLIELSKALAGIGKSNVYGKGRLSFFSVEQAKDIINYCKISLFQHYKLYEWMFNFPRDEVVISAEQVIEVAKPAETPLPSPLEEGIPSEIYMQFMAPVPLQNLMENKETEKTDEDLEKGESLNAVDPPNILSMGKVKTVLNQATVEAMGSLQTEINEKLRVQEEAYPEKIENLEKP
ncbi:ciliary-associated calcium-binding coiled-coil protein 1 [Spea bombifrons]|uniref:ciliary-associated calcium-binding coiled-coil protein 1 n=1 Tax=Spea bombifrons TaxID=233779 RepID=UPI002349AB76|nr:ciliary-associated calcium-binding coiled-coil protein 1 [Spea bombifrons]